MTKSPTDDTNNLDCVGKIDCFLVTKTVWEWDEYSRTQALVQRDNFSLSDYHC
jgi:hypothetical protein